MTRKLAAILMICLVVLVGCADTKVIDGVEYDTYGFLSQDEKKNPDIRYEVVWGNVFWGVVLFETIVAPVYFFGFSIWEPKGRKSDIKVKGQVPPN